MGNKKILYYTDSTEYLTIHSNAYNNGDSALSWKHTHKRDNFFLQHDDNGVCVCVWRGMALYIPKFGTKWEWSPSHLNCRGLGWLHRHSGSYAENQTLCPWQAMCSGSQAIQPAAYKLEYFILKTDIQTWSLWVLIYCQRALMMAGRVWVWTPRSLAKRGSSLNWRGW
jgi:hypothetical protein